MTLGRADAIVEDQEADTTSVLVRDRGTQRAVADECRNRIAGCLRRRLRPRLIGTRSEHELLEMAGHDALIELDD